MKSNRGWLRLGGPHDSKVFMKTMNEMTLASPGKAFDRRRVERKLSKLRKRLLETSLSEVGEPAKLRLLRLAAGEAEALASLTPFPLLVLPELLHEKLDAAKRYVARQTCFRGEP